MKRRRARAHQGCRKAAHLLAHSRRNPYLVKIKEVYVSLGPNRALQLTDAS